MIALGLDMTIPRAIDVVADPQAETVATVDLDAPHVIIELHSAAEAQAFIEAYGEIERQGAKIAARVAAKALSDVADLLEAKPGRPLAVAQILRVMAKRRAETAEWGRA